MKEYDMENLLQIEAECANILAASFGTQPPPQETITYRRPCSPEDCDKSNISAESTPSPASTPSRSAGSRTPSPLSSPPSTP
ncbi:hypothetical protein X975_09276, partial [Stegodyphus mimosarum]